MERNKQASVELSSIIETLDNAIDEYSKNIFGYKETADTDTIYEEYVSFLTNIKSRLEVVSEITGG